MKLWPCVSGVLRHLHSRQFSSCTPVLILSQPITDDCDDFLEEISGEDLYFWGPCSSLSQTMALLDSAFRDIEKTVTVDPSTSNINLRPPFNYQKPVVKNTVCPQTRIVVECVVDDIQNNPITIGIDNAQYNSQAVEKDKKNNSLQNIEENHNNLNLNISYIGNLCCLEVCSMTNVVAVTECNSNNLERNLSNLTSSPGILNDKDHQNSKCTRKACSMLSPDEQNIKASISTRGTGDINGKISSS